MEDEEIEIRVRHRAPLVKATISFPSDSEALLTLKDEQRAITAGQSVVFYSDNICLGGGIII